ncbi:MAG: maleylacetoacetate isomerase [Deltaproteobacteria bacterium]|nr:maleylacetoacetate isomerase [Deltaproteobacteria bacterium]
MKLALHNYWRSSASHRVRIALGLKELTYDYVFVSLVKGEQLGEGYRSLNSMAQLPTLEITEDSGARVLITQSLAILEYLEERWPTPSILPRDLVLRAKTRALAEIVNSGIQPLQNLSTTNAVNKLGGDSVAWVSPFIASGLLAFANAAAETAGTFCVGDTPTIADCCLIPQLASARRFKVDITGLGQLLAIEERCLALPAFAAAMPDQQPDAVKA